MAWQACEWQLPFMNTYFETTNVTYSSIVYCPEDGLNMIISKYI